MGREGSLEEGLPGSRDRSSYPDGESEDDEDENGEKSSLVLLSQISLNNSSDLTCLEAFTTLYCVSACSVMILFVNILLL